MFSLSTEFLKCREVEADRRKAWLHGVRNADAGKKGSKVEGDVGGGGLKLARLASEFGGTIRIMNWQERISVNPAVRSGKPCIRGTRITVYDVLEYLAGGMAEDEILADFPDLKRDDIRACLAFAAARERRVANSVQ